MIGSKTEYCSDKRYIKQKADCRETTRPGINGKTNFPISISACIVSPKKTTRHPKGIGQKAYFSGNVFLGTLFLLVKDAKMSATATFSETNKSLKPNHFREWRDSNVNESIIMLNVTSIEDTEVGHGGEVTYTVHERLNLGVKRQGRQARESLRGWWVDGLDPLSKDSSGKHTWSRMEWGRFKPDQDTPLMDWTKHRPRKYSSPYGMKSRAVFLDVPKEVWDSVAARYEIPIDDNEKCFWEWVRQWNVPIVITEGEKKAGCLLTQGYAAISIPGINSGCRSKDAEGNQLDMPVLIPELEVFASKGREIYICFDFETKPKVVKAIKREVYKLSHNFKAAGAVPRIINLPGPEKGVDDFIAAQGAQMFEAARMVAVDFAKWERQRYTRLTFAPSRVLNQEKLGDITPRDKFGNPFVPKFTAIRSPKGSGKTESLVEVVSNAIAVGQRVLMITHRVQLGMELGRRLGLSYVTDIRESELGDRLGYVVCVDSLHQASQARFNPEYWEDAIVIIDEVTQVIWHSLDARTEIDKRRNEILSNLRILFERVLDPDTSGRIIVADADLNDLAIRFVAGLGGFTGDAVKYLKPYIIDNRFKPEAGWHITNYQEQHPLSWYEAMRAEIATGGKVFVVTHSQKAKSKWSTKTMEELLGGQFPDKRILRIDSQTISNPGHPACGCLGELDEHGGSRINELLLDYDIVLVSPTMETGVSIDLRGHFTSVWGCFQGVSPENSVRQALARVRENVPRHVWVTNFSRNRIANGDTTVSGLMDGLRKVARLTGNLLSIGLDPESDDFINPTAFETWAKMAASINAGMRSYRTAVIEALEDEGHVVDHWITFGKDKEVEAEVIAARDRIYGREKEAIVESPLVDAKQGEALANKKERTDEENFKYEKFRLNERYGGVDVTDELIELDGDGWYPRIQLYYYLTVGNQFLEQRERGFVEKAVETKETWLPSLVRGLLAAKVKAFSDLGVLGLLNPEVQYSKYSPEIKALGKLARQYASEINTVLKVTISPKDEDIAIAQKFLGMIGMRLSFVKRAGKKGERYRVYQWAPPDDNRNEVYVKWLERDTLEQARKAQARQETLIGEDDW